MQIKPVNKVKTPDYPNEYLFINNPELFRSYMPMRWSKNKAVASALLAFLVAGAPKNAIAQTKANTEQASSIKSNVNKVTTETKSAVAKVAPIFVHGDGRGATGCVVMSPPVYISESEAMQIISEELLKEGITIDTKLRPNFELLVDKIGQDCFVDYVPTKIKYSSKMSGTISRSNFVLKYITCDDFSKIEDEECSISSVIIHDVKKTAEIIRNEFSKTSNQNAVFFYDPLIQMTRQERIEFEKLQRQGKKLREDDNDKIARKIKAREALVAQVCDFVEWVKKEGMILAK